MANIVIVTKQCYLLCEAINFIAINEVREDDMDISLFDERPKKRGRKKAGSKKPTRKQIIADKNRQFQIIIDFIPVLGTNNNNSIRKHGSNPDSTSVGINVTGRDRCLELFAHMVTQIREQIPDNVYLDKLAENFLTGVNIEAK